jgi:aminoglycoside 3-N-acetyltransferase
MNFDYTKEELFNSLEEIIKIKPEVIFISGNLAYFGRGDFKNKQNTLDTYIEYIKEIAGEDVTIVTSSFTHQLINTDEPFELKKTKSMHGVIPNYFLEKKDSIQSIHPFTSFVAIGPKAEYICTNNTRHPYGVDSPYERMLSLQNPITISLGMAPNITCSIIHHSEVVMNVPYRYTKEFNHPIKNNDKIANENYYLPVTYLDMDLKRNLNKNFMTNFERENTISVSSVGKGTIYGYGMKSFYESTIKDLKQNIYAWLDEEPEYKPYRK